MAKVVAIPQNRKVLTERMMRSYAGMFEMVWRHVELQKEWEDELIARLAQGWKVAPDSALEFEFGEKTAVVSRIRVVKRKAKAG